MKEKFNSVKDWAARNRNTLLVGAVGFGLFALQVRANRQTLSFIDQKGLTDEYLDWFTGR